jgi:hypothetical protein
MNECHENLGDIMIEKMFDSQKSYPKIDGKDRKVAIDRFYIAARLPFYYTG